MWFDDSQSRPDWREAQAHLSRADPRLRPVLRRVGPCTLGPRRDHFTALCQAIFTQQVSTAVATILFARFRRLFPRGHPTPRLVLAAPDEQLGSAGLSRQKLSYLRDLAGHFVCETLPTRRFGGMDDEQIIEALTQVRGIGRWTAEMFLIFVLNRTDVLPVDDLGLRKAMHGVCGLKQLPSAGEMLLRAEPWRPYRSIATWYLWRGTA